MALERYRESSGATWSHAEYPGMSGTVYKGGLDAFHGETHLPVHPRVQEELIKGACEFDTVNYVDLSSGCFDFGQPLELQELAAEKLFNGFLHPATGIEGVQVQPNEVITCPSSSLTMLEAAIKAIRQKDGVIVCPQGYYKSVKEHIDKFNMRLVTSPLLNSEQRGMLHDSTFKINPVALEATLTQHRLQGDLCGVLLTMPGNPVMVDYTSDELKEIARILAHSNAPVICDMAFDKLASYHIPLASLEVEDESGQLVRMHDRVISITGTSKGFNASGDWKMGAACSGNQELLEEMRWYLPAGFTAQTAYNAGLFLKYTDEEYFEENRILMIEQQLRAREHVKDINDSLHYMGRNALNPYGLAEGLFCTIGFSFELMANMGLHDKHQVHREIIESAGIDNVSLRRSGSSLPGTRFNVFAPRRGDGLQPGPGDKIDTITRMALQDELFDRLGGWVTRALHSRQGRIFR